MSNPKCLVRPLLWFHLFICFTWLYVFRAGDPHFWAITLFLWSIFAIQFTWGFTVGLAVGPARKSRSKLWWSLVTLLLPLSLMAQPLLTLLLVSPLLFVAYLSAIVIILASETYAGVLLGAKMRSAGADS
jgi:hypothetical protein